MSRFLMTMTAAVALCVTSHVASAALLAFDVNDRTAGDPTPPGTAGNPANTPAGFESWTMNASGTTATQTLASGYTVQFDIFDDGNANDGGAAGNQAGAFDDRDRPSPTGTPTRNEIYDDFIFAGQSAGPTGGLDMSISGGALLPNTPYRVSIYAFDGIDATGASGFPIRTAAWVDGNNLDAPVLTTTFVTNVHPTTDDQYKFTGIALTDGTGKLFLKGRRVTALSIGVDLSVYVDGVEINAIPEPASLMLVCFGTIASLLTCRRRTA